MAEDNPHITMQPRVTAVACKRPLSFCQKCRWQVTATETRMHLTYVALHEVTWCMVVWCTQNAPKWQQFHVASTLVDIQKRAIKSYSLM